MTKYVPVTNPVSKKSDNRNRDEWINRKRISREKMKRDRLKKKQKIAIICAELVVILCMFSFLFGKEIGAKEYRKDTQTSVTEKETIYKDAPEKKEAFELENNKKNNKDSSTIDSDDDKEEKDDRLSQQVEEQDEEEDKKKDILLVNKEVALPEDYEVELMVLPDRSNRAAKEAYEPLCAMLEAGQKEGLVFEICSSYRDVERQQELFDEDLRKLMRQGYTYEEAYEEVASETMPPGHSEHSTGLAFDIVAKSYQMLNEKQAKTAESKWLREHCAEYGFILRYPEGKEDITQINYESWHFRYIGDVEIATYIMENNLTLEEYLEED